MRLRGLIVLAAILSLAPLAAEAQESKAGRLPTIGYVSPAAAGPNALVDAFNRGLREAGFVEGRNIVVDRRYMGGREDEYDQVMAQLEQQKVDVIVAVVHLPPLPQSASSRRCPSCSRAWAIPSSSA